MPNSVREAAARQDLFRAALAVFRENADVGGLSGQASYVLLVAVAMQAEQQAVFRTLEGATSSIVRLCQQHRTTRRGCAVDSGAAPDGLNAFPVADRRWPLWLRLHDRKS